MILQWDETFDTGSETGTPVDDQDYQVPFKFTGKLNKLTVKLERPELTPADIRGLKRQREKRRSAIVWRRPLWGLLRRRICCWGSHWRSCRSSRHGCGLLQPVSSRRLLPACLLTVGGVIRNYSAHPILSGFVGLD